MEKLITETNATDIIDQEVLAGKLERLVRRDSIAIGVSDIQEMTGPSIKITAIDRDKVNDKLIVKTKLIEAVSKTIKSEFTPETLQDLKSIYGEDIYDILAEYFATELTQDIDDEFVTFIKANATAAASITFNPADFKDYREVVNGIIIKINQERVALAQGAKRPLNGYAIVSSGIAIAMISNSMFSGHIDTEDTYISYLGNIAGLDIYLDNTYVGVVDYVVLGLKGNGRSRASTVFTTYTNTLLKSTDEASGELRYHLLNRSNYSLNPFDTSTGNQDSIFLRKFDVDLSSFNI